MGGLEVAAADRALLEVADRVVDAHGARPAGRAASCSGTSRSGRQNSGSRQKNCGTSWTRRVVVVVLAVVAGVALEVGQPVAVEAPREVALVAADLRPLAPRAVEAHGPVAPGRERGLRRRRRGSRCSSRRSSCRAGAAARSRRTGGTGSRTTSCSGVAEPHAVGVGEVEDVVARERAQVERRVAQRPSACGRAASHENAKSCAVVEALRVRARVPVEHVRPPAELAQLARQVPRVVVALPGEQDAGPPAPRRPQPHRVEPRRRRGLPSSQRVSARR